jgi:hypothetical protein
VSGYEILLVAHIAAAILALGPVASSMSRFPATAKAGHREAASEHHRTTSTYGLAAIAVPILGIVLAQQGEWLDDPWFAASFMLTAIAGAVLAVVIVPSQRQALRTLEAGRDVDRGTIGRLHGMAGLVNLLMVVTLLLMVWKPG